MRLRSEATAQCVTLYAVVTAAIVGCGPTVEQIAQVRQQATEACQRKHASMSQAHRDEMQTVEQEQDETIARLSRVRGEHTVKAAALEGEAAHIRQLDEEARVARQRILETWPQVNRGPASGDVAWVHHQDVLWRVTSDSVARVGDVPGVKECWLDERAQVIWLDGDAGVFGFDLTDDTVHPFLGPLPSGVQFFAEFPDGTRSPKRPPVYEVALLIRMQEHDKNLTEIGCAHETLADTCYVSSDQPSSRILDLMAKAVAAPMFDGAWREEVGRRTVARPKVSPLSEVEVQRPNPCVDGYGNCKDAFTIPRTPFHRVVVDHHPGDPPRDVSAIYDPRTGEYLRASDPTARWQFAPDETHVYRLDVAPSGTSWLTGGHWVDLVSEATRDVPGVVCGFSGGYRWRHDP